MTAARLIVSCDLRRRIENLEAFADQAELQAVIPPAHVEQVELFTEFHNQWARLLRQRASQLRDELADVEGQQRMAIA